MLHCGHSREALVQQGTAHTRRGAQRLPYKGSKTLNAKLRMGWEPPGSHPIRLLSVLESLNSGPSLCMPLNSVFRRLLSLRLSFTLFAPLISDSSPLRQTRFIRKTDVCPLTPHPSCPYIDPTFVGGCPPISGTSTSRSSAAPVIHRNGTRTL